jgi:eukaryotic-like serine/threonine-protein kinase
MRYCAKCRNSFSNNVLICPNDGSYLTDARTSSRKESLPSVDIGAMEESLPIDSDSQEESLLGDFKLEEDSFFTSDEDQSPGFNTSRIIGQTIDGKYHVQSLLGMGGMGAVYRARHTFINNDVAIKIIRPREGMSNKTAERFLREARAAVMVDHPNAIKVTDFGRSGEMLYLVMEFIQGYSVANLIRKEGSLSPTLTAKIMVQICAALDAAHSHNIIHRDLKPENIMIKQNDPGQMIVKVLDFGLAKFRSSENWSKSLTSADTVVGTLSYMSPEQCRGDEVIDLRSDIYSLGVVAFEMLTGKLPFVTARPTGLLSKHMFEAPPRLRSILPGIPEEVERAVLRALEKKPEARYSSAGEFAAELSRAAQGTLSPKQSNEQLRLPLSVSEEEMKAGITQQAGLPTAQSISYETKTASGESRVSGTQSGKIESAKIEQPETRQQEVSPAAQTGTITRRRRSPLYIGLAVAMLAILAGGYYALNMIGQKGPAQAGSQKTDPAASGMLLIEGGWLKMGSLEGYDYEQPVHDVYVDSFYIDETEVTNEKFEKFVLATGHKTDAENLGNEKNSWRAFSTPDRRNHPVVLVSWNDAAAYAKWAGKRLPTEAEWEYAARGGLIGKKYPWGDDPPPRKANFGRGRRVQTPPTEPVKSYEPNGYGLYDMAGNVSEWCQDWYDPKYYSSSPERNPSGPSTGQARVYRGGSWYTDFNQMRIAGRLSESQTGYEYDRGFRCAKSR